MNLNNKNTSKPVLLGLLWITDPIAAHEIWRPQARWGGQSKRLARLHLEGTESGVDYARSSVLWSCSFWRKFCRWINEKGLDVTRVREENISAFLADQRGIGGGDPLRQTVRAYRRDLDRVFHWLEVHEGLISSNPVTGLLDSYRQTLPFRVNVELPANEFLALYEESATTLFRAESIRHPGDWLPIRNLALRLIASECGLMSHEICALSPQDVGYLPDGTIKVFAPGHGSLSPRTLIGSSRLRLVIESWMEQRRTKRIRRHSARSANDSGKAADGDEVVRLFLAKPYGEATGEVAYHSLSAGSIGEIVAQCVGAAIGKAGAPVPLNSSRYIQTAFVARLISVGTPERIIRYQAGMKSGSPIARIRDAIAKRSSSTSSMLPPSSGPFDSSEK